MAWIELHQDVTDHKKTLALGDALDLPEYAAVGLVSCLWLWAVDNADTETGEIEATPRQIARAIRWDKDPQALTDALIKARYLVATENGFVIPNWDRYIGKLIDQRAANAERQKRHREAKKAVLGTSQVHNAPVDESVTVTLPLRNAATRPDLTVPNRTVPEREGLAVEKHGPVPESEMPPPQDAEQWAEGGQPRAYPAADRLFEAFCSERYPTKPFKPARAELIAARKVFAPMLLDGITPDQVKRATAAALRRFKDRTQVTPAGVARNWTALLEDDPPQEEKPRSGGGGGGSSQRLTPAQQRAKAIRDRNNAELERDLAAMDEYFAAQRAGGAAGDLPPVLKIASGGVA